LEPSEDVNTFEQLQQFLAMRLDLETILVLERRRGFLTRLETAALLSADRGPGKALHATPETTFGADRAPCSAKSAWKTRHFGLPDFLIQEFAQTYELLHHPSAGHPRAGRG